MKPFKIDETTYNVIINNPLTKLLIARKTALFCMSILGYSEVALQALSKIPQEDFEYLADVILSNTFIITGNATIGIDKIAIMDSKTKIFTQDIEPGVIMQIIFRVIEDVVPEFIEGIAKIDERMNLKKEDE